MRVALMLTCLCDAFFGEVGIASVRVLESIGCEVDFPEGQTCCGQPPYNSGDWNAARALAKRTAEVFGSSDAVVTPSASCAAMLREGYRELLGMEIPAYELCQFVTNQCDGKWEHRTPNPRKVAYHASCHGRSLGLNTEQADLLAASGFELLAVDQADQCCGFGGAFSITHETLSTKIGAAKLDCLMATGAKEVVGGDMGCLMHLRGLAEKQKSSLRFRHVAELLAEGLPA